MAPNLSVVPPVPPEVPTTMQSTGEAGVVAQTIPAGSTIDALPKPLMDAIMQAIAQQICSSSQRSTERMKEILKRQEAENRK